MTNSKIKATYINPKYGSLRYLLIEGIALYDYLELIGIKYFKKTFKPYNKTFKT